MQIVAETFDANTAREYFVGVDRRIRALGLSRAGVARHMEIGAEQLTRYFTHKHPNPTLRTVVTMERVLLALEHRQKALMAFEANYDASIKQDYEEEMMKRIGV